MNSCHFTGAYAEASPLTHLLLSTSLRNGCICTLMVWVLSLKIGEAFLEALVTII